MDSINHRRIPILEMGLTAEETPLGIKKIDPRVDKCAISDEVVLSGHFTFQRFLSSL